MEEIGIGILGLGNVGSGVVHILQTHQSEIEARLGARPVIRKVAVRDLKRVRDSIHLDPALFTDKVQEVIEDPTLQIVLELMGGVETARDAVLGALAAGKHVVTANKTLLAYHGDAIMRSAAAKGLDVFFEAAVGGGLPVIRILREALASDRLVSIVGILNGTTNFVLGQMGATGSSLEDAVALAQEAGYAEADPSADLRGQDAAEKLCLLAALAFGVRVSPSEIPVHGIEGLTGADLLQARELGYEIKLLARAVRGLDGRLGLSVGPTLVPKADPLASIQGADNAVALESAALGRSLLVGAGAGGLPTGSAVVSDLMECCRNLRLGTAGRVPAWSRASGNLDTSDGLLPACDQRAAFYLRVEVEDRPGVLGALASALGAAGVSLAVVMQREHCHPAAGPVSVIVLTHPTSRGELEAALKQIGGRETTLGEPCILPLLPEGHLPEGHLMTAEQVA